MIVKLLSSKVKNTVGSQKGHKTRRRLTQIAHQIKNDKLIKCDSKAQRPDAKKHGTYLFRVVVVVIAIGVRY